MAKVYGIGFPFHNHSAVYIEDGKIKYAVEDDKMMRTKTPWIWGWASHTSLNAIEDATGVSIEDADYVAIGDFNLVHSYYNGFNRGKHNEKYKADLIKTLKRLKKSNAKIKYYTHHDCHAASTYYLSGFDKALVVTLDGGNGEHELGTIQLGNGLEIHRVYTLDMHVNANSLATIWYYSCPKFGFVGNKDEGKIMGMAGHGVYNERLYKGFKSLLSYNKGYLSFSPNSHDFIYEWFFNELEKEGWFTTDQGKADVAYAMQQHLEEFKARFGDAKEKKNAKRKTSSVTEKAKARLTKAKPPTEFKGLYHAVLVSKLIHSTFRSHRNSTPLDTK